MTFDDYSVLGERQFRRRNADLIAELKLLGHEPKVVQVGRSVVLRCSVCHQERRRWPMRLLGGLRTKGRCPGQVVHASIMSGQYVVALVSLILLGTAAVAFAMASGLSTSRPDSWRSANGIVAALGNLDEGKEEVPMALIQFDVDSGPTVSFWSRSADPATRRGDGRIVWFDPAYPIETAETDRDRGHERGQFVQWGTIGGTLGLLLLIGVIANAFHNRSASQTEPKSHT